MRHIIILSAVLFFVVGCKNSNNNSTKINSKDSTKIEFTETRFEFGDIVQGERIQHTFKFKNVGDKPLVISEVHSSCGCTIADYSDKPLSPGSEGYIKVSFNSAGKQGNQYKTVTIISNTKPGKNILVIRGNVKVPKNQNSNQ